MSQKNIVFVNENVSKIEVINLALEIAASTPDHVVQIMKREYGKILNKNKVAKVVVIN